MITPGTNSVFAGFRFPPEVISVAAGWYLRYGLSYRDVEELLAESAVSPLTTSPSTGGTVVTEVTLFRRKRHHRRWNAHLTYDLQDVELTTAYTRESLGAARVER